jgi:streptogramin lyase
VLTLAVLAALGLAMASPTTVDSNEPMPATLPTAEEVVAVLADDAGRRFDRGNVREVEIGADGTVWLAVGRRVLALDTPGAAEPRARGWEALPRRLAVAPDGALWAVEDGGATVVLGDHGWVVRERPRAEGDDRSALDEAALEQLRDAGIERAPRVLAEASGHGGVRWLVVDASPRLQQAPAEYRLLRGDGSGWTVLGPGEGLRDTRRAWTTPGPQAPVALTVDRDGRAWFSLGADGLWLADGEGIHRVRFPGLGSGALDLAGTPDGTVWIASTRGGLFRWSPEASEAL